MPLLIVRDDIAKMSVDAIVSAGTGALPDEGTATITTAGDLPSRYVIHTSGPVWNGGSRGEEALLRSCYRSSLGLASASGCVSVAFPLISSGSCGYPEDRALDAAVDEIRTFLLGNEDMLVYIIINDRSSFIIDRKLYDAISSRFDDRPVFFGAAAASAAPSAPPASVSSGSAERRSLFMSPFTGRKERCRGAMAAMEEVCDEERSADFSERSADRLEPAASLDQRLGQIDESFTGMLLRKIDESDMTDVECYKRANIDRKLFSKIRSDINYRPSKPTVIAFAIALRLSLPETREMLMKAGFALSRSNKFDIIIEYFIENGNYDVFDINEALFAFDQPLLA